MLIKSAHPRYASLFALVALVACGGGESAAPSMGATPAPVPVPAPAPAPAPASSPVVGTVGHCFDVNNRLTQRWSSAVEYRNTNYTVTGQVQSTDNFSLILTTGGTVIFDGVERQQLTISASATATSGGSTTTSNSQASSYLSFDGDFLTSYGFDSDVSSSTSGASPSATRVQTRGAYTPAERTPLMLQVGGSWSYSGIERLAVTQTLDGVMQPTSTSSNPVNDLTRFAAIETITVPAGSYATCRMESLTQSGVVLTRDWVLQGVGVSIRTDDLDSQGRLTDRTEALSVTVNGVVR